MVLNVSYTLLILQYKERNNTAGNREVRIVRGLGIQTAVFQ